MKRVVLLVRVSSDAQETETQKQELIKYCLLDKYTEDEMYIIENVESATKKQELFGLKELKQAIQTFDIECVYCWELSRLSRRREVLEELRNIFDTQKINLICKHECLNLYGVTGKKVSPDAQVEFQSNMIFDMYKNMIVHETILRLERITRGKKNSLSNYQYIGGQILFGYSVDENKNYVIDNNDAAIVKLIFDLYSTGNYSVTKIHNEINSRGLIPNNKMRIYNVLNNRSYTGEEVATKSGNNKVLFPAIITTAIFEKCSTILKQKNNRKATQAKNIYYAGRLIKCQCCGQLLIAHGLNGQYVCSNFLTKKTLCSNGTYININVVDSLSINVAATLDYIESQNNNQEQAKEIELKIIELNEKIDASKTKFEIIQKDKTKQLRKVLSYLNDKEFEQHLDRALKEDKLAIEKEVVEYKYEIERLTKILDSKTTKEHIKNFNIFKLKSSPKNELKNLTEKQCFDMVHKHIEEVIIKTDNKVKEIIIKSYSGKDTIFYYDTTRKINDYKIYSIVNGKKNYLLWQYHITERIQRSWTR